VEPVAPCPFAEFGRDRVRGDDLRRLTWRAETGGEGACDAAHGKPVDGRTDIARSRGSLFERQSIEGGKVFAVHERPAHRLARHHTNRVAFDGLPRKAKK